ncbi:hypothetical protein BD626DRAFT_406109 [Schizophyllum amplum]|uniref:BTB domain-containing protein n=1 Tax=Schizophyllum amplum TaxID=97359 RepID=A0A550C990_9AGAR|nr:hypothetical protein BD626DRAFT_406109 [Auriculariopsis ampla]
MNKPWFDDGNIIISAGGKRFKVHRSILAAQSAFFSDLFSVADADGTNTSDGCQVVELHDSPAEVADFLRAIFDSSFFDANPASKPPAATICGVLRLAHKYDVPYLRRRALAHASRLVPRTYKQFVDRALTESTADTYFRLADVALETGVNWLLPTVLEACARSLIYAPKVRPPVPEATVARCAAGVEAVQAAGDERIARLFFNTTKPYCLPLRVNACADSFRELQGDWESQLFPAAGRSWKDCENAMRSGLCTICFPAMVAKNAAWTEQYWDGLPAMFGLGSWSTLESERREDLRYSNA